ncbi:hypothetical protein ISN45_At05g010490 [Arabidopsis thaliana x Arabidopsis arenosa]|uniref:Uncharacterized protein n=3 Tax=Arabidopsis TaxID=3701 RepID=B3H775_ARATH|nr:uncharacterized protein AT5G11425 [Arabidopsis thaliana]AED91678.1 hypothetical protein AT5G11425 [Arabidopsis thaliana]KAG7601926.1 hypothetical protein ISN45_At05g010490 [Arabidopsis thaliana x Arabidopsis arenosa]KAG7608876.1 hypothetical protein ISN44_As05g010460 [Arabidopsis suecica]|eukprot:NP_001119210.1 hypothetical protein AT5G11425 [Arabidopsis thaliana]
MYQKQRPETQRFNPKRTDTLTHLAANRGQRYIPEYKFEQKKKSSLVSAGACRCRDSGEDRRKGRNPRSR